MRPFGAWEPDRYELNANVAGEAAGVLPVPDGYQPWPALTPYSTGLPSACRGAVMVRGSGGQYKIYAGTATKLYVFDGGTGWTEATRLAGGDYVVAEDTRWSFARFGTRLIACQENDDVQFIDIDSGTNFAALGGSPPKAKGVIAVGDQVFLVGLLNNPNRVIWSGRNNSDWWTVGQQDCDFQDFPSGGFVNGLAPLIGGTNAGLIFQDEAINFLQAVADKRIYTMAQIEGSTGLKARDSLVVMGPNAYYLSEDGFMETGLGGSRPIGADRVDGWFQDNVYGERIAFTQGCVDPVHRRVFWLFPTENAGYVLDQALCYDKSTDRWTHTQLDAEFLLAAASPGISPDGMTALGYTNLDLLPFSLDNRIWQGGAPSLAGFDSAHKLSFFAGANLAATMETGEWEPVPGRRMYVRGIRPYTDSASGTIAVSGRENQKSTTARTYAAATAINDQGFAPQRVSTRFSRARLSIAAGETWNKALGVEYDADDDGER